jgi:hypothetical protein
MLGVNTKLQQIIDAHPKSVHQLLKGYGILKAPSPEVLVYCWVAFGNPFLAKLVDIVADSNSEYSNYIDPFALNTALDAATSNTTNFNDVAKEAEQKKSIWDTLGTILTEGASIITEVNKVINPGDGSYDFKAVEAAKKAESDKKAKTLLWVGITVIIIIIIAIIISKSHEK